MLNPKDHHTQVSRTLDLQIASQLQRMFDQAWDETLMPMGHINVNLHCRESLFTSLVEHLQIVDAQLNVQLVGHSNGSLVCGSC